MHEMSVAAEICRMTEEHVGAENLANVINVCVEVGEQAGLEIDNLEFCLEVLLTRPPFGNGRPTITRLQGDILRLAYLEVDDGDSNN